MPTITFNAFASLQKKLKKKNIDYNNAVMNIESNLCVTDFLSKMEISGKEVEAVLINGRVKSLDTIIKDGDRIAFIPKFTNCPNRNLPGLKFMSKKKDENNA
jgi:molybdopterin converting factor small subunit